MEIKNIVIVGGGTAGWMTAAYLSKNLWNVNVTIIDKEIGNAIGVGEATLLSFKPFMEECGFQFDDWAVELEAGYKAGILFTNWNKPGNDIWHPFFKGDIFVVPKLKKSDIWSLNQEYDYKKFVFENYNTAVNHNSVDYNKLQNYAFHINCGKLVLFLQEKLKNKVKFIKSDVVDIVKNDEDNIKHLVLKDGSIIEGDLFIDCTGFKQILRKPKKRIDLMGRLFVNTAVVCQVPYQDRPKEFTPYAICDAVDHGWIWKIGISSRIGSGMIFNRDITDIEEAKKYFVDYWNNRIDIKNVRVIDWDPYYIEDQWSGNIVNIGLSSGFIEPLESTGIGFITTGITQLYNVLREGIYSELDKDQFNLQLKIIYEDTIDFVSCHYDSNTRETPFWNYVKNTFKPSPRMLYHIKELDNPDTYVRQDGKINQFFGGANWTWFLIQLGYKVAPRKLDISQETASEILIKDYVQYIKYNYISSRHHSSEIDRIKEFIKA